jgi:hypothetical protein
VNGKLQMANGKWQITSIVRIVGIDVETQDLASMIYVFKQMIYCYREVTRASRSEKE